MSILKKLLLPASAEDAFERIILVDSDDAYIAVTGIEPEDMWGYTLNVRLENRTESPLMFSVQSASVNGYMSDPIWAAIAEPGAPQDENICFSMLETDGITGDITSICLAIEARDYTDFLADPVLSEVYTIYPLGEAAATVTEREAAPEDIVLFDDGSVSMTVTGFYKDDLWGYSMQVYLVNRTEQNMLFNISDAAVNGLPIDPFWAFSLMPGTRAFSEVLWSSDSLSANGITSVDEIALNVTVGDAENWGLSSLINDSYTVTPAAE